MRQAINNLQSTHSGFGFVSQDNVFKICDQPHPIVIQQMIKECQKGDIDNALARIGDLWDKGYSAVDIVVTVFRVVKGMEDLPEYTKLEYIRVSSFQLRLPQLA
jgi:replication factor C subunit 2/4